jgi:ABC-type transport system substrate-binding protein
MKHNLYRLFATLVIVALLIGACGTPPTPAPAAQPTAEQKPVEVKPTEKPAEVKPTEPPAPTAAPASKYNEAPALADQVKAGTLPPVEERLPKEPLVVEGSEGVGKYGGTWRRGFTGPSDYNGYVRVVYDSLVRFSPDGTKVEPKVALGWENSADFKEWTILLREGAKWSDGQPMTADDILF